MARNKPQKPLTEDPPEADSSVSGTASSSSGEEAEEDVSGTASSSSGEEEEETPSTPPPPSAPLSSSKKLPSAASADATTTTRPIPKDDSDTDDDEPPLQKIKSISKATVETPSTASKPRSKSTVAALASEKRPSETELKVSSKKPRKEKSGSGPTPPAAAVVQEEGSKKLFQRVFSEDDETEILKGMIEYRAKKGADPMVDVDDFYVFVKKSLHVDVNKVQIVDKVRRLKKKFFNAKKKKLTNPHEIQAFELSKKIWDFNGGDDVMEDEKISNGAVVENNNNVGTKLNSKARVVKIKSGGGGGGGSGSGSGSGNGGGVLEEMKNKKEDEGEKGGGKVSEFVEEFVEKDVEFEVGEAVAWEKLRKKGLRMMGAKARAEIDEMWEKVAMMQAEAKILRSEVEQEETRRIMEALRSGKN